MRYRHLRQSIAIILTLTCSGLSASCITAGARRRASSSDSPQISLPKRSPHAEGGRQLVKKLSDLSIAERERIIVEQIFAGNVPSSMRRLVPVRVVVRQPEKPNVAGSAWVLPDYLSIGSDSDHIRIPMTLGVAREIAAALGLSLPTVPIVEAIYEQAAIRLPPSPLPASTQMTSIAYILRHEELLATQLATQKKLPSSAEPLLIAGHKKDVVLAHRAKAPPRRVAIFGWHRDVKKPIQPLSTVHGESYVDYSHGIRLVAPLIHLDTRPASFVAITAENVEIIPAPSISRDLANF